MQRFLFYLFLCLFNYSGILYAQNTFTPPRITTIISAADFGDPSRKSTPQQLCHIDKGREANISFSDVLKVFRERRFVGNSDPVRLFIGTMNIIEVQQGGSLGVFTASPTIRSPAIDYNMVMAGDLVAPQLILEARLLFDSGLSVLRQGANVELDKVAGFVQVFAPNKIIIEGHTDSDGGEASNMRLSEERARSVRLYLVDNFDWITPVMVEAVGYGEERPRAENTTEDNKQLNRRIEFTVID